MRPISNPKNPWVREEIEWDQPPEAELHIQEEQAKSALTKNDSPDIPYDFGLNPYRGCIHACAYCYARRHHQFLGFGAGTDFERRLVVKSNLPQVLDRELRKKSWKRDPVSLSGITDCYQPIEARFQITRQCLEVLTRHRTPYGIITKSSLIERDIDLLRAAHEQTGVGVAISIPILDPHHARLIEPYTPSPARRFKTIEKLSEAGIPVGVSCAPTIPGLNESSIPEILKRAREAGAQSAFTTLVRLSGEVAEVFEERLRETLPDRADRVLNAIRSMRGGKINRSGFFDRMVGEGDRWKVIEALFQLHCRKNRLNEKRLFPEKPKNEGSKGEEGPVSLFDLDWSKD